MSNLVPLPPNPRSQRRPVTTGGVRRVAVTLDLLVEMFEWGTQRTVPLDPPDGLEFLAVRINRLEGRIEALVRSPSFRGGESAWWHDAEWWNPPFQRVGGPAR